MAQPLCIPTELAVCVFMCVLVMLLFFSSIPYYSPMYTQNMRLRSSLLIPSFSSLTLFSSSWMFVRCSMRVGVCVLSACVYKDISRGKEVERERNNLAQLMENNMKI